MYCIFSIHTYTHTGILFSQKIKEILPFTTEWIYLEGIMQNEIKQTETDRYHIISLVRGI